MGQFLTVIGKLAINSESDSAVGDVFVAKPKNELQSRLGTVIGLIELFAQPDEFVDKFFEIINDLETEYYLPPYDNEGGVEKRFEECLQRANRRLNKIISDSLTEIELKNIDTFIGLTHKNTIYLSSIGKSNAFLFHRKKKHDYAIIDIFSQAGEKNAKINQAKMFSNIINGIISEKDNLFFCNDSILEYLSQNELMEIITANRPALALKEIEKILSPERRHNNFYAITIEPLIKENETKEELRKISVQTNESLVVSRLPSQTSINRLISTQENTEKYLTPSLAPNWKKILILFYVGLKTAAGRLLKYAKIIFNQLIKFYLINSVYSRKKIQALIGRFTKNDLAVKDSIIDSALDEKNWSTAHQDQIGEFKEISQPKIKEDYANQFKKTGPGPENLNDWLNSQIEKFVALSKLQQILLVAAIILIFFFSQSLVWQGQADGLSEKDSLKNKLAQIEERLNTGEAKNIFNDETGARESLKAAIDLLSQIPDNRKYDGIKKKFQDRIETLNQSLQKISYLDNPTVTADLANQNKEASVSSIDKFQNYIFAFDNHNQNIYKIDLAKKQTSARQLPSNFNRVRKIAALDETNVILLNSDNEMYKYNFDSNSVQITLTANSAIDDFNIYGGKLYTLQSERNQIFKHFPLDNGYNSGSAWLKDQIDLKNATTLVIDGGIYTGDNNGQVKYFMAGRNESFNLVALNPALASIKQIETDTESPYLYVLDQSNQRLVVFDKNSGQLKKQFSSKEFSDLKSLAVETKEKNIYLLADKKIYLIETNF